MVILLGTIDKLGLYNAVDMACIVCILDFKGMIWIVDIVDKYHS